jgi:acyl-CoA dehydrogenase
MARSGIAGPSGAITTGYTFGLPPLLNFGSKALQEQFLPDLLLGKKRTCIAITEPGAGSDVANLATTATKSEDGKHYIVNGVKKWISNALWAGYATMAVRTGGPGPRGLSLMLVPLKGDPGVKIERVATSGLISAGTTQITLTDVQVPVENLIGEEGMGMRYIMTNFNHERLMITVGVTRQARVALSAAFEYCLQREAFGKPLMEQAVVRHRLAKAGAELESMWAWAEAIIYQLCCLKKEEADVELGGITALAKAKAGMVLNECALCAVILFGGSGYTKTGPGEVAESEFALRYTIFTLTLARDIQGCPCSSNRWGIRRCYVRSRDTPVGEELPEQNKNDGAAKGV